VHGADAAHRASVNQFQEILAPLVGRRKAQSLVAYVVEFFLPETTRISVFDEALEKEGPLVLIVAMRGAHGLGQIRLPVGFGMDPAMAISAQRNAITGIQGRCRQAGSPDDVMRLDPGRCFTANATMAVARLDQPTPQAKLPSQSSAPSKRILESTLPASDVIKSEG
jgi:hypothetical protein